MSPSLYDTDLISKFMNALAKFDQRSAALERNVFNELTSMRNEIEQLKLTIASDQNTVSLPKIMEQQRLMVLDMVRELKPQPSMTIPVHTTDEHCDMPAIKSQTSFDIGSAQTNTEKKVSFAISPKLAAEIVSTPPPQNKTTETDEIKFSFKPKTLLEVDANQEKSKSVNTLIDQGSVELQSKASVEESQEKPKPVSVDTLIDDVSVQMKSKASVEESQNKSKSLFGSAISEVSAAQEKPKPVSIPPKPLSSVGASQNKSKSWFGSAISEVSADKEKPKPVSIPPKSLFGSAISEVSADKEKPKPVSIPPKPLFGSAISEGSTVQEKPVSIPPKPLFGSATSEVSTVQENLKSVIKSVTSSVSATQNKSDSSISFDWSFLNKDNSNIDKTKSDQKQSQEKSDSSINSDWSFLNKNDSNIDKTKSDPKQSQAVELKDGKESGNKEEGSPEEFVPDDSQLKRPEIELPAVVELKTGEENEEVMFSHRCRIYRFLSGETKERGTGELKLLKDKQTGKIRCVMRRDQTLKICANFSIHPGFQVHDTKQGENFLTWHCKDFSDADQRDGEQMTLICRFKNVEGAKKFKEITSKVPSV